MNYCIYLKKRKNKPYCNIIKREISFSQCQKCDNKEYKTHEYNKQHFKTQNNKKMLLKSNKLAKLEKNRFSVFTNNKECFVCKSTYQLTWNEIFRGRNRVNSMKYGFCLRMCLNCHTEKQEDIEFNDFWHEQAQIYFENNIGSRNEFITIFRRNYLI